MKRMLALFLPIFFAVWLFPSPSDSIKCYVCAPCKDDYLEKDLTTCHSIFDACGKLLAKEDGHVYRSCITEKEKKETHGECDVSFSTLRLSGCAFGCTGDACNSAPLTFLTGHWQAVLASLLATMCIALFQL